MSSGPTARRISPEGFFKIHPLKKLRLGTSNQRQTFSSIETTRFRRSTLLSDEIGKQRPDRFQDSSSEEDPSRDFESVSIENSRGQDIRGSSRPRAVCTRYSSARPPPRRH
ncbi:hypothetical protein KM043_003537 [Ampulex compressa]|nr:hypothetical protein KM043_003537 [Ampulex compressa]